MSERSFKLVEGFAEVIGGHATVVAGREWLDRVAWRRYFKRGWQIRMDGGMFIEWRTDALPRDTEEDDRIVFVWDMGLGCVADSPQPTGEYIIEVNGKRVLSFCSTTIDRTWKKGECHFHFEVKRRDGQCAYGLGYLLVPGSIVRTLLAANIRISASDTRSQRWFILCQYGEGCLATGISFNEPNATATYIQDGLEAVQAGPHRLSADGLSLYWGDLHVHSSMANYIEHTPDQNYEYGRDVSQLDFMAITDQEHFLTEETFPTVVESANKHHAAGEFVTFIAYEWSSRLFGHRNVIFKGDCGILVRRHNTQAPYEPPYAMEERDSFHHLCKALKHFGGEVMLLPHHPSMCSMGALDWSNFDSELERVAEIYSLWGSSEYRAAPGRSRINDQRTGSYYQDALAKGYCLGIIGSGEAGDGHPGNTQWRRTYADKAGLAMTPLGGGLTAVWAKELTRESIFDAIKVRRCYGTTNARIALKFKLNNRWMGERIVVSEDDIEAGFPVTLELWGRGTDDIECIHLFANGRVAGFSAGYGNEMNYEYSGVVGKNDCLLAGQKRFAYFYARVTQKDGHMAWSSPVWICLEP